MQVDSLYRLLWGTHDSSPLRDWTSSSSLGFQKGGGGQGGPGGGGAEGTQVRQACRWTACTGCSGGPTTHHHCVIGHLRAPWELQGGGGG
jgi:hypothetical protein